MSDRQDIATRTSSEVQTQGQTQSQARRAERSIRPPADVYEDVEGITLHLDMPGVSKERLTVKADKDTLSIEGEVQLTLPQGMEALYAEVQSTHYARSFTLSGELDADKAEASLRDGVLTLRIPKRAELRPRRIQIT